eukprot:gnl/TRDRNA2_/TRDRNA2_171779_c2_seq1.p1 gnl/TRDRNA2_/TRDRNA2_171779_c2~~gnl/TRDRNA2_/TRDRNA2_171779_c2_seq1.p1  ORF type:complete len:297 (-),score=61.73 gnl/TRDRNA2_/TRDRNA2_171779_c2_seq1:154-1008(-)
MQQLEQKLDVNNAVQVNAWRGCAAYLKMRTHSKPQETLRPYREPDMSEQAAAAFLAVLEEVANKAEVNMVFNEPVQQDAIPWAEPQGEQLQAALNHIFGDAQTGAEISGLAYSVTIADPMLPDCPLIGCSTGFSTLVGYSMNEIIGRNCRFLVDPVPEDFVDQVVRRRARAFCEAASRGDIFKVSDEEREKWMPSDVCDEVFSVQINQRKDGVLFRNMFYMRKIDLDGKPYIVGLQAEMPDGNSPEIYFQMSKLLNGNMTKLEHVLTALFWCTLPMKRQESPLD